MRTPMEEIWRIREATMDERDLWRIENDGLEAPFISADYQKRYNVLGMRHFLKELEKKTLF